MKTILMVGTFLCSITLSQGTTLSFEDLPGPPGQVPSNYEGLTWTNWVHYGTPLSPFNPGTGQVRLFPQTTTAKIQFGQDVTFVGAWLAGQAYDQYFEGYKNGIKLFESSHIANDQSNFGQSFTLNWTGVDEIRLQAGDADRTAFDDLQYNTCTPPPPNMVSWWPGDGNANDIQDGNSPTETFGAPQFVTAEVGQGFKFDGDDGYAVPDDDSLDFDASESFTIETWVRVDGSPASESAVVEKFGGFIGYRLSVISAGGIKFEISTASGNLTWINPMTFNDFHHVAVVADRALGTLTFIFILMARSQTCQTRSLLAVRPTRPGFSSAIPRPELRSMA